MKAQISAFDEAAGAAAPEIRAALVGLPGELKRLTNEIRLRTGRPVALCGAYGSLMITPGGGTTVQREGCLFASASAVADTFNRLCGYSLHSHQNSINNGYITMRGGHRAGISGTAVRDSEGKLVSVRDVSCINLRIAREHKGAADALMKGVFSDSLTSVIVAGPPSSGKTTVLRDLARQLSVCGERSCKVALIDEREELAAVSDGVAQFDVGDNTDVLDSYPKSVAVPLAVRTMSPDIVICDEVSEECELAAIAGGVNSGVRFAVSVHASDFSEILRRPQIERLISTYSFDRLVLLDNSRRPGRVAAIFDTRELRDEIYRDRVGCRFPDAFGALRGEADEKTGRDA